MQNMEGLARINAVREEKGEDAHQTRIAELAELLGAEDAEGVATLIKSLQAEIEASPNVGRTLQEQTATHRKEFVIPLVSKEQKERLLSVLSEFGIHPWEENGLLVVERASDLKKLELAGFIETESEEIEPTEVLPAANDEYAFKAKSEAKLFPSAPKNREGKEERRTATQEEEPEAEGIDTELKDLLERFDQGLVDDDDPELVSSLGSLPTLSLFPRQYIWEGKTLRHARTGELIPKEKLALWRAQAKEGDERMMEKCVRVHVGLVLHVLARLKKLWPHANADDLLQEGLMGLVRSVQIHDPSLGGAFSSHAINHIESRMRRYIQIHERGDVLLPVHTASERADYHRKEKELMHENPGEAIDRKELSERLASKQIGFAARTEYGLDKFERTYFIHTVFDPLDESFDEEFTQDEVDMSGKPLAEYDGDQLSNKELDKHVVTEHLSSLPPREQVVLRLRFGILEPPISAETFIEAIKRPLQYSGRALPQTSLDLIKTLESYAPENYDPLSFRALPEYTQVILYLCGKVPVSASEAESILAVKSEGLTLERVAMIFNQVTRDAVRQIETKGLRLLKNPRHSRKLRPLLPDNGAEEIKWREWRRKNGYE